MLPDEVQPWPMRKHIDFCLNSHQMEVKHANLVDRVATSHILFQDPNYFGPIICGPGCSHHVTMSRLNEARVGRPNVGDLILLSQSLSRGLVTLTVRTLDQVRLGSLPSPAPHSLYDTLRSPPAGNKSDSGDKSCFSARRGL